MSNQPLTDTFLAKNFGSFYVVDIEEFVYRSVDMRRLADWQLDQVIEQWEEVNDSNKTDIQVIREFDKRLKEMRQQHQEEI